jgi:hypothetical protein
VTFSTKLRPGFGNFLTAQLESEHEVITINVEPGEVYFLRFTLPAGLLGPGTAMELVDKSTGETEIRDLKLLEPWQQ